MMAPGSAVLRIKHGSYLATYRRFAFPWILCKPKGALAKRKKCTNQLVWGPGDQRENIIRKVWCKRHATSGSVCVFLPENCEDLPPIGCKGSSVCQHLPEAETEDLRQPWRCFWLFPKYLIFRCTWGIPTGQSAFVLGQWIHKKSY